MEEIKRLDNNNDRDLADNLHADDMNRQHGLIMNPSANEIVDNKVIVRYWNLEDFGHKVEHVSLEIPSINFYRSIGVDRETKKLKLVTSFLEDCEMMGQQLPIESVTLTCLDIHEIKQFYDQNEKQWKEANYSKFVLPRSEKSDSNRIAIDSSLQCAMFVRALLEAGGINAVLKIIKQPFPFDILQYIIYPITVVILAQYYADESTKKYINGVGFLYLALSIGLIGYNFTYFADTVRRCFIGQRGLYTTPKGILKMAQEASKSLYHPHIIAPIDQQYSLTENKKDEDNQQENKGFIFKCCSFFCGMVATLCVCSAFMIVAALPALMFILGAAVLSAQHSGYSVSKVAKIAGLGWAVELGLVMLSHVFAYLTCGNFNSKEANEIEKLNTDEKIEFDKEDQGKKFHSRIARTVILSTAVGNMIIRNIEDEQAVIPIQNMYKSFGIGLLIMSGFFMFCLCCCACCDCINLDDLNPETNAQFITSIKQSFIAKMAEIDRNDGDDNNQSNYHLLHEDELNDDLSNQLTTV